ncbi:TPA: hypothetical protein DCR79_01220 [Patescibacteria group bacterium]|nr:hypothetical protein [Patescibacteria group bacterium]
MCPDKGSTPTSSSSSSPIGEIVRLLRTINGESQAELAETLRISPDTLDGIEKGHYIPGPELMDIIVEHFDMPMALLTPGIHGEKNLDLFEDLQKLFVSILRIRTYSAQSKEDPTTPEPS